MTGFLQVPPFPGARPTAFWARSTDRHTLSDSEVDRRIEQVRTLKVGGTYWSRQPQLPADPFTLIRVADPAERSEAAAAADGPVLLWSEDGDVRGECDPWHLLANTKMLVVDSGDELALIAAIVGVPVKCVGSGPFSRLQSGEAEAVRQCFRSAVIDACSHFDPFTGEATDLSKAIEYCGFWRRIVDSNRDIGAAIGFGVWKQETVAPLLWGGSGDVPFEAGRRSLAAGDTVAIWKARTPIEVLTRVEASGAAIVEVEDGFIRSAGLGADCVPPLSIVVDRAGIYFDPSRPSDLEALLQEGGFAEPLLERARALRDRIVESGISKYESGGAPLARCATGRRHLLVPGQVEDDRSVQCGGGNVSTNLELLRRVRANAPDAFIAYKPHPDVEAGHRAGALPDRIVLAFADEVVRNHPISSLMEIVDEVHVNTSLAGFEALVRSKLVTTYGVPFFAGWGLTTDLGDIPSRRTRKRTLDELVAAALLLYPRYLDPVTGLPCPPEILIQRLSESRTGRTSGALVRLRQLHGKLRRVALALWAR